MTLRFAEAVGTPVYSKVSADELGRVIRCVVDPATRSVAAVHLGGRRARALLADWDHIVGFGPDAVVVDSEDHLRHPEGDYEERATAGHLDLRGRRVLTDSGFEIGALLDVEFDESSGALTMLRTNHTTIVGDGLRMIGPYAVIVRHDAVQPTDEPPAP